MLSVSTTATWSRMAVIHARCDRYFWTFAPTHSRRVHHTVTSVVRLRVASLLQFDGRRIRTRRHKGRPTAFRSVRRVGRRPAQAGRDPTQPALQWGCARSMAPQTCLSAVSSFHHHPLAFSCPTRSLAGTLCHTFWCNLLTRYSEQKSQPLSRQCFTRDTWHRTSPSSSPSSQPSTCLAATVSTTPAPGRGATP